MPIRKYIKVFEGLAEIKVKLCEEKAWIET